MSDINTDVVDKAVTQFGVTAVAPDDIYAVQADVFAPCLLGAILSQNTIHQLKVKVVAGAANNQLANEQSGDALRQKGIFCAPDYVVNAGGIINAAMEMLKTDDPSFAKAPLSKLPDTLDQIIALAESQDIGMHLAADLYVEDQLNKI